MNNPNPPILLQLTEEQQAIVHRLSGQHLQALELTPDATEPTSGTARAFQFLWRKSVASGIPRQKWETVSSPLPPEEGAQKEE